MMRLPIYLLLLLLAACSSTPPKQGGNNAGRYNQPYDAAPTQPQDISALKEPTVKAEPRSRYGNPSSYTVLGKTYRVLNSAKGYDRTGYASWYGTKFQGFRTSSGETYDMYKFTAANKVLPLPTYVRVTNLDNGRSLIVRVNDRGPFHPGRIIDLSWAAAKRLGVLAKGTAHVRVQSLTPQQPVANTPSKTTTTANGATPAPSANATAHDLYLQTGAFSDKRAATNQQQEVRASGDFPASRIVHADNLYRVWIGPFKSRGERQQIRASLEAKGYSSLPKESI